MQPDLMLLADIGDLVERIECSDGRRAGAGNHRNDGMAIIPKAVQSLIELSDIHAAAIIEALAEPALRQAWVAGGLAAVEAFSSDHTAERTLEVYREVLREHGLSVPASLAHEVQA